MNIDLFARIKEPVEMAGEMHQFHQDRNNRFRDSLSLNF